MFMLIVVSILAVSGCKANNTVLNSRMECDDGRIVSIGEGCEFNYNFYLNYESWGWGNYQSIEIFGDGRYIVKEMGKDLEILRNTSVTREGKLNKNQIETLMVLVKSKFFNLPVEMGNELCMDASERTLTATLNERTHTVAEYCSGNEDYATIVEAINDLTLERDKIYT